METKTKIDAAEIIGIEPRQMQNLADRGIVDADGGGSKGAALGFNAAAMYYGMVAGEMLKFKMSSGAIIESIAFLKKYAPKPAEVFKMRDSGSDLFITVRMDGNKQITGWYEYDPKLDLRHFIKGSLLVVVIDAGAIATKIMNLK